MKKQTYITVLEDKNGWEIDFERWTYKRAQTCISKLKDMIQARQKKMPD